MGLHVLEVEAAVHVLDDQILVEDARRVPVHRIAAYLAVFCSLEKSISESSNPWNTFTNIIYSKTTPTMESIRRVRQKYQESGKYLGTKRKEKLAGGYFSEDCIPYDLKEHYEVIKCPDNTKIDPYNEQDLFIQELIEQETNMEYTII